MNVFYTVAGGKRVVTLWCTLWSHGKQSSDGHQKRYDNDVAMLWKKEFELLLTLLIRQNTVLDNEIC